MKQCFISAQSSDKSTQVSDVDLAVEDSYNDSDEESVSLLKKYRYDY